MKKILILSIVVLAACNPKLKPNHKGVTAVADANNSLAEEKALYESKCAMCHKAKNPSGKTVEQWNKIVPRMAAKAANEGKSITTDEQSKILKYLVAMSSK